MLEAVFALGVAGEFFVAAGEVAVVLGLDLAAVVLGDVPSPADPFGADGREALGRIGRLIGSPHGPLQS